eukprot:COSAG06_NODE_14327_length_1166_cov_1.523899_2_plen_36_part_01
MVVLLLFATVAAATAAAEGCSTEIRRKMDDSKASRG